jgi:putative membrane protein
MGGRAMMMEWNWPMASAGWMLMLVFWILVIIGIIVVIRRFTMPPQDGPQPSGRRDTPVDILRKRYAAGEIDRQQFETMKKDLED